MKNINGIKVVNLNISLENEIYGKVDPYTNKGLSVLEKYLEDNDAHLYVRVDEEFSLMEAVKETTDKKKSMVIVENLS